MTLGFSKNRRREKLRQEAFPDDWLRILERNVAFYGRLTPEDRRELQGHILVFVAEKEFEGCGGLEITDEMRVTIAAQACILLLHRETGCYPGLRTVLVYPGTYVAHTRRTHEDGVVSEGPEARLGEAWRHGPVVLAWDEVASDATDIRDGRNVVFHEFAHKLDEEDGAENGIPALPRRSMYLAWGRVLGREYERLRRDAARGRPTVLDEYGAEDMAEFFAVATECFFTKPLPLRRRHPELYAELAEFYRQDPAGAADPQAPA
ncbi:MAG: zinc-dependent peptidase [Candidatus Brocadiaceae bacterium]|nr:zinc-dependent peptidase [Candidatus Brocadiaceae bacterium]